VTDEIRSRVKILIVLDDSLLPVDDLDAVGPQSAVGKILY
jgi:hypothetical protein